MCPSTLVPSRLAVKIPVLVGLVMALSSTHAFSRAGSWPIPESQEGHSAVSQSRLTPPLRSTEALLRFSPDGNYLSLQDPSGVTVLLRNPLKILLHISADNVYPVEFSPDSQSLVLVSRGLTFSKWRLPDGEKIASGDLASQEDCLDGSLSPGGEFFACLRADLDFVLLDISGGKTVFERSEAPAAVMGPGGLHSLHQPILLYFAPLDFDSAFAGPFGIIRTQRPGPYPNHLILHPSIRFSPDCKTLIARLPKSSFGLDIVAKKSFEPPSTIQKALPEAMALQTSERVIAVENEKGSTPGKAAVISLTSGDVLANLSLTAARLQMSRNPRFVVEYSSSPDGRNAAAFDLEQNHLLETPPALALDVYADELAVYTQGDSIALYRLGERNLVASLPLPLTPLPPLRSASVTPNLDRLAFSVDGIGAIFDVTSGQRIATLPKFSAMNFLDQQYALMLLPRFREEPAHVSRVDLTQGAVSSSWEIPKEGQFRSGGSVLLDYSMLKGAIVSPYDLEAGMAFPYSLRAVDPGTGKELWKREFKNDPPTPFADPQGDRLVLGWKAKSSEARSAASRNPVTRETLKKSKLTDHDSFFEVLDARSGNSLGGVLVMAGNGASSFDAALSAGDTLILQKDSARVSLYSLADGELKTHLLGVRPSASAASRLLALELAPRRLGLFDLTTGTKFAEKIFTESLAYTHFSADGKRLFVLTERQAAIILDVGNIRNSAAATSEILGEKN